MVVSRLLWMMVPALFFVSCLRAASQQAADDWPLIRHDAQNTAYTSNQADPPFRLTWRIKTNAVWGEIILASGNVVCVGTYSAMPGPRFALFNSSGKLLWSVDHARPAYLKGGLLVVAAGSNGHYSLDCYNWKTKARRWSYPLPNPTLRADGANEITVLEENGSLFCSYIVYNGDGTPSTELTVLKLENGTVVQDRKGIACEGIDGQTFYWGASHWLHAVNRATLTPAWGFYDGGWNPVIVGSVVIAQGWWHKVTAIDTRTRKELWTCRAWRDVAHSLAKTTTGKTMIVESFNDPVVVAGIDVNTGRIEWRYPVVCEGYAGYERTAGAGHYVFVPGYHLHMPGQKAKRGGFYCLDADTGKLQWKYETPEAQGNAVIVSGQCVYGLDTRGFLYKFVSQKGRLRSR